MNNVGKLLKSNAVADEHDSSNDTSSDGESHKTSNLWTDAKITINKDHLLIYCYILQILLLCHSGRELNKTASLIDGKEQVQILRIIANFNYQINFAI